MLDLIKRLEEATKGSGKLDREICETLGLLSSNTCEFNHWPLRVTSSIDAAVALAERVLPGWGYIVQSCGTPAAITVKDDVHHECRGATPALALCIAILKAKEASDEA